MINLDDLTKVYPGGTVAVDHLSLEIPAGEVVALVGPSGCGKTTTMRMINRLEEPTSGRVLVDGRNVQDVDVQELRRHIGYVIQAAGLFPHYTVEKNVATVCELLNLPDTNERVARMLELVGLAGFEKRYPAQLSGGQRQRVGVARALAADPPVLLMDEPFGAVDPIARGRLQAEFGSLQRELGTTTVIVTHDIDEAVRLSDRIAVLREGGILEQYATPAEVLGAPASDFVAEFTGADRTLKRLAISPIDLDLLQPVSPELSAAPAIDATSSIRDGLARVLESEDAAVQVVDDGGNALGVLTLAAVHQMMRDVPVAGNAA